MTEHLGDLAQRAGEMQPVWQAVDRMAKAGGRKGRAAFIILLTRD